MSKIPKTSTSKTIQIALSVLLRWTRKTKICRIALNAKSIFIKCALTHGKIIMQHVLSVVVLYPSQEQVLIPYLNWLVSSYDVHDDCIIKRNQTITEFYRPQRLLFQSQLHNTLLSRWSSIDIYSASSVTGEVHRSEGGPWPLLTITIRYLCVRLGSRMMCIFISFCGKSILVSVWNEKDLLPAFIIFIRRVRQILGS